jgi:hypothetical protein
MSGKKSVINIGKKVVELIRQNILKKYGAATLIEKDERNITDL